MEYIIAQINTRKSPYASVWRNITQEQIEAGHGGMDTLTLQAFFGAALSGEEMPIDVYDAASWMVITCLTEASIANGGMPIDIPDFTGGKWILREPKDVAELILLVNMLSVCLASITRKIKSLLSIRIY